MILVESSSSGGSNPPLDTTKLNTLLDSLLIALSRQNILGNSQWMMDTSTSTPVWAEFDEVNGVYTYKDSPNGADLTVDENNIKPLLTPSSSIVMSLDMSTQSVPTTVPDGTRVLYAYINNMQNDLDLTGINIDGLADGAHVTFSKADTSNYKIIYGTYTFVQRQLECITLVYNEPTNTLNVI
jgi:hypothetical protein